MNECMYDKHLNKIFNRVIHPMTSLRASLSSFRAVTLFTYKTQNEIKIIAMTAQNRARQALDIYCCLFSSLVVSGLLFHCE